MTELLERAFEQASKLTGEEQDRLAEWILAELESDEYWDELMSKSRNEMAQLGRKALKDYREGRTETLDPDRL
jgi:hypothetical protein